mgnify:CR=1 FL=1
MYALLMLGKVPSHCLKTLFRTVSERLFSETRSQDRAHPYALGSELSALSARPKPIPQTPCNVAEWLCSHQPLNLLRTDRSSYLYTRAK